jgi:hypothetical protein
MRDYGRRLVKCKMHGEEAPARKVESDSHLPDDRPPAWWVSFAEHDMSLREDVPVFGCSALADA